MSINRTDFDRRIKEFQFKELFNEFGWDSVRKKETVAIAERVFELDAIAEKRDFLIFVCSPLDNGNIADTVCRKKIDRTITKLYFEHLIIYVDGDQRTQIWQLSIREPNKPVVTRETAYYTHQTPELLHQRLRGLLFTLDEEDKIGLVDVKQRVSESFNVNAERVTKQFYDRFKKEHRAFLSFIEGIDKVVDKEWYASLMLNRLMFIYFIQKKGFLDNDKDYLRNRLRQTQEKKGKNKFYCFYRDFLLVLFHKGLGSPESERAKEIKEEIGRVPYLNGGLFDVHHIEKTYQNIHIDDDAFELVFDFFDQYQWHLDTRITSTGRDINPDVIGYIFEKYINDRAAMGAYYTKEDITEYISKSTVIPYLFNEAKKECANAFRSDSSLWKMLQENPDRYIYDAVKHGVDIPLNPPSKGDSKPPEFENLSFNEKVAYGIPEKIAVGIYTTQPNLLERRKHWNTPAPPEFALPTEIWREVLERRKRYWEIRDKIEKSEIQDINDFITYNLDIRQFAQDAVQQYEGSDFINAVYKAITKITVLDPTCGSGAFLFAALNVLEPLYEACIQRMQQFVEDDDTNGTGKRFPQFRKVLADIQRHPNLKYYIYKSIILNNLYGVDIMKEAVEIAKLRLFLKLVAEVDDIEHVEPMPDIDYNIRAGNTLVGFATYKELQEAVQGATQAKLDLDDAAETFREEAEKVGMAFQRFKDVQLVEDQGSAAFHQAKEDLQNRLNELNEKLNVYLAKQYGIESERKPEEYEKWKLSHQPFHWFAEFYEIVHQNGGFDVIIGNPPYVEYSKTKKIYTILYYETISCGNLYAYVIESCYRILTKQGLLGFIVQLPIVCTDRMKPLQNECISRSDSIWFANFDDRPGKLFDGLEHIRATIFVSRKGDSVGDHKNIYSTKYNRWYSEIREHLFSTINFDSIHNFIIEGAIPKIGNLRARNIFEKLHNYEPLSNKLLRNASHTIYFHNSPQYWIRTMNIIPFFWNQRDGEKMSTQMKFLHLGNRIDSLTVVGALNSSLFYWWFILLSDCRHLNLREIETFPLSLEEMNNSVKSQLVESVEKLMVDYEANKYRKEVYLNTTGDVIYDEYYPKKSKPLSMKSIRY